LQNNNIYEPGPENAAIQANTTAKTAANTQAADGFALL
jgi:hypothetical protein